MSVDIFELHSKFDINMISFFSFELTLKIHNIKKKFLLSKILSLKRTSESIIYVIKYNAINYICLLMKKYTKKNNNIIIVIRLYSSRIFLIIEFRHNSL